MKGRGRSVISLVLLVLAVSAASQWWAGNRERQLGQQVAALAQPGDIRMLSSETCAVCRHARAWFEENRVHFNECLIEHDAVCRQEFDAVGAPGTPVLVVRGKAQLGFNPERLLKSLQSRA